MAIAVIVIKQCKKNDISVSKERDTGSSAKNINRDHGFDRRISYLEYSNHARCRMECRHITKAEVEDIMQDGKIN